MPIVLHFFSGVYNLYIQCAVGETGAVYFVLKKGRILMVAFIDYKKRFVF